MNKKITLIIISLALIVTVGSIGLAQADSKIQTGKLIMIYILGEASNSNCANWQSCLSIQEANIDVGDTIRWSNTDTAVHTITSGDPLKGPNGKFDSGLMMIHESYLVTFNEKAEYSYYCMLHPWVKGTVSVE